MEKDQSVPIGGDFLKAVQDQERRCEERFNTWLPNAGIKVPKTVDALGTALSYLDRLASCWWGSSESDHKDVYLVGRAASNARAALQLIRTGHYDEAFSLIRQIGENANLICLFVQSGEEYTKWKGVSEEERRNHFSLAQVIRRLENLKRPLPMDKKLYNLLSKRATHTSPENIPQGLFNPFHIPTMGGYFQEAGTLFALNHLAGMIGHVLYLGVEFIEPPTDRKVMIDASVTLFRSIGSLTFNPTE